MSAKVNKKIYMTFTKINNLKAVKSSFNSTFNILNNNTKINNKKTTVQLVADLLFEHCTICQTMAAVPQGAFIACKFQEIVDNNNLILTKKLKMTENSYKNNNNSNFNGSFGKNSFEERELTPMKYSSKLMNSIWGLYNRYSPHNFKKNTDAKENVLSAALENVLLSSTSPTAATTAVSTPAVTEVTMNQHVI